jgi:hypothetical protein
MWLKWYPKIVISCQKQALSFPCDVCPLHKNVTVQYYDKVPPRDVKRVNFAKQDLEESGQKGGHHNEQILPIVCKKKSILVRESSLNQQWLLLPVDNDGIMKDVHQSCNGLNLTYNCISPEFDTLQEIQTTPHHPPNSYCHHIHQRGPR